MRKNLQNTLPNDNIMQHNLELECLTAYLKPSFHHSFRLKGGGGGGQGRIQILVGEQGGGVKVYCFFRLISLFNV